ncbi:MAG: cytochrome c biogenesis protein ResB [Armatimonadetes bacterium]|nr:cytochrome c biogenesis protein ResB [Armatimonadota bacterium]
MAKNQTPSDNAQEEREIGIFDALWSLFSSMKTAIALLLIIAFASVLGTVIEQNATADVYIKAYGEKGYALLRALGLTDVYHSGWYVLLLSLFSVNLAVCTIKRFGIAWRRTFCPEVVSEPEQIAALQRSEEITTTLPLDEALSKVVGALRNRHYSVRTARPANSISVYAAKGRLGIWGPYITHFSMLIIFAGAIAGGLLGSRGQLVIAEGEKANSYVLRKGDTNGGGGPRLTNLGFSVRLRSFIVRLDKLRRPTSYRSDLEVYEGSKLATRKVVEVNSPLTYKGTSFYQADYGLAGLVLRVTYRNGDSVDLNYRVSVVENPKGRIYGISSSDNPMRQVALGGKKLTLYIHNIAPDYVGENAVSTSDRPLNPACDVLVSDRYPEYKGIDAWTRLGWLPVSKSANYKGFRIELVRTIDYTVLEVAKNPGLPIVYLGFGLILLGVFVSFYTTSRTIRVSITASGTGSRLVIGATSRAEPAIFDKDLDHLQSTLTEDRTN